MGRAERTAADVVVARERAPVKAGPEEKTKNFGPHGAVPSEHPKPTFEVNKSELRYKVAIRFAIQNDVRFISHHDTMRMFERALARTDLPVRFSQGFNPRPKLSLPLPRPVGIATLVDVIAVEMVNAVDPAEALRQLAAQMPDGVTLLESWIPASLRPMQPASATYTLEISADQVGHVGREIQAVLQAETWPVRREAGESGPGKTIDLKSYLLEASLEGERLEWSVRITGGGSIRPSELLAAVGLEPEQWQHRVCRTAIAWQTEAASNEPPDAPTGTEQ